MNYVVLDLEFNQSFDFAKNTKGQPEKNLPFEIIQIGAVKLNDNFEVIDKINIMIKPVVYKRLHPFVKKITGFHTKDFANCLSFSENYKIFTDFCGSEEYVFCVWGNNDILLLYKNIIFYELDKTLISKKYIDVQTLAGKFLKEPSGKLIGLKNAIISLEIPIELEFHDAFNDAIYTSLIFIKIKNKKLNINTFKLSSNRKKETNLKNFKTDLVSLYSYVEKEYGKKLTKKDKLIVKTVYEFGKNSTFEI